LPQPGTGHRLQRAADLPHRSLPGEGDRPEPDGLPLRQRHLRAGLEPPLHRSRADYGGGVGRRRRPRRLLRDGRRAARHGAEPPVPAAGADRNGAAELVRRRSRPCLARQRAALDRVVRGRVRVLRSIRPFTPELVAHDVVRGQYLAGAVDGKPAVGYREEPTVAPTSNTETYVALKLLIDNWRWADVPFYLRTGERLARRVSEIAHRLNG